MKLQHIKRVLLHQQVAEQVRAQILKCKPGERLESENILAKKMGVSPVTMRSALLLLSKEGLIDRRQGSGTIVLDRGLTGSRHVGILMEIDITYPRTSHSFLRVIYALRQRLIESAIPVKLYLGSALPGADIDCSTCPEFLEAVEQKKLCAAIGIASTPRDGWLEKLTAQGVPAIGADFPYQYRVGFDVGEIVPRSAARLLEQGCRHPVMIALDRPELELSQQTAFVETLRNGGISADPVRQIRRVKPEDPGSAWEAMREFWLFSERRPDGLLVADDSLLNEVTLALLELGVKVPQQLKVVSHVNKGEQAFFSFPLSCLQGNAEDVGDAMFEMAYALIKGESVESAQQKLSLEMIDYVPPHFPQESLANSSEKTTARR